MSNSSNTLVGRIAVSVGKMAPVSIEFENTESGESDVADFFRSPLVENKSKNRMFVELKVRVEASPQLPSDRAMADVVEVVVVVVTQDTCPVLPATSVVRGPPVEPGLDD